MALPPPRPIYPASSSPTGGALPPPRIPRKPNTPRSTNSSSNFSVWLFFALLFLVLLSLSLTGLGTFIYIKLSESNSSQTSKTAETNPAAEHQNSTETSVKSPLPPPMAVAPIVTPIPETIPSPTPHVPVSTPPPVVISTPSPVVVVATPAPIATLAPPTPSPQIQTPYTPNPTPDPATAQFAPPPDSAPVAEAVPAQPVTPLPIAPPVAEPVSPPGAVPASPANVALNPSQVPPPDMGTPPVEPEGSVRVFNASELIEYGVMQDGDGSVVYTDEFDSDYKNKEFDFTGIVKRHNEDEHLVIFKGGGSFPSNWDIQLRAHSLSRFPINSKVHVRFILRAVRHFPFTGWSIRGDIVGKF